VAFLTPCYLAFQLGWWTLAAAASAGWPEEAARLHARATRYRDRLATALAIRAPIATPPHAERGSPMTPSEATR
jgi:hypothetical protein